MSSSSHPRHRSVAIAAAGSFRRAAVVALGAALVASAVTITFTPAAASTLPTVSMSGAAAATSLVPSASADAASAAQWSVAPADAEGPDGRISLRHVIDPGATVDDAIAVTNLGSETETFAVIAGDGRVGADGAFDISAGEPEDAGSWFEIDGLESGQVAIPAGETRVLPVRIAVPSDALPGDHPAGIVVGVSRADDGVTVTNRIGVRAHLRVAGEVAPALEISDVATSFTPSIIPFAPGTVRVEMTVANTGNARLGAVAAVSTFGGTSSTDPSSPVELLPGDARSVVIEASGWPVMLLAGEATVRPVVIGDDGITAPAAADASFTQLAVSWTGLALIVLIAAGVIVLVLRRRSARRATDAAAPGAADDRGEAGGERAADAGAQAPDAREKVSQ